MGCKVTNVKAPNGEPSNVYASISRVYGAEVGLVAYLHMHSPEFKNLHGNKQLDKNGEYHYKLVMESMEAHGHSVTKIVERSVGLRKGNGTYATFKDADGKAKVDELNNVFKRERTPFVATLAIDTNGDTVVHIDLVGDINLDPNSHKKESRESSREDDGDDVVEEWLDADEGQRDALDEMDNESVLDMLEDDREMREASKITGAHKLKNLLKSIELQKVSIERRISAVEENLKLSQTQDDAMKVQALKSKLAEHRVTLGSIIERKDSVFKMGGIRKASKVASSELAGIAKKVKKKKDIKGIELEELTSMQRVLKFWAAAGSFDQDGDHILFSTAEQKSNKLKDLFREHKGYAEELLGKVNNELDSRFESFLKDQLGSDVKMSDVMKLAKDINYFDANTLDISRTDHAILQSIYKAVTQAEQRGIQDADIINTKIDEMMPAVMKELESMVANDEDPFAFFAQKNEKGEYSGDAIQEVSYDFLQAKKKNFISVIYDNKSTHKQKKAARQWSKDNEIIMDYRRLFPEHDDNVWGEEDNFSNEDREAHIAELKEHMGDEAVDEMLKQLERNLKTYELEKEAKSVEILSEVVDERSAKKATEALDKWEMANSPFYASKNHVTGEKNKVRSTTIAPGGMKYAMFVPKKTIDGKDTGYYDKNFARMKNNPVLNEFFTYYMETMAELNMAIPTSQRQKFKNNSIAFVQRTLKEMGMSRNNKPYGQSFFKNAAVKAQSSKEYSNVVGASYDPITGDKVRHVQANFINDGKSELRELVRNKQLVWQAKNKGEKPTKEQIIEWRYEALNELASEKSYDLGSTLKHYAQLANAYKYKAAVEDEVHLAYNMFQRIKEGERNTRDLQLTDTYGDDQVNSKGMRHMSAQLDYFMDRFNNFKTRKDTTTEKKIYTELEKERKKELEKALETTEKLWKDKEISKKKYVQLKNDLQESLDALGNNRSLTKIGDGVLNFSQIAGMGWNIPAGIVNRLFGWASNHLEAASGRFMKPETYKEAERIVGGYRSKGKNKKSKVQAIAKKWGIIVDTQREVNEGLESALFGWLPESLQPYNIGNEVEFANQAPIMVGKMLETMVTDNNGNETNLFMAFDEEGNMKDNYSNIKKDWDGINADPTHNKELQELIGGISQTIKKVHGNYHQQSPVKGKETLLGRSLFQFKSWLPEAIESRFGKEKYDAVLKMQRKGRYRSVWESIGEDFANSDSYAGFLVSKFAGLLQKALFGKYDSKKLGQMSEVDIQNMREVAKELQMIFLASSAALALSLFRDSQWDEEEDNYLFGPKWALTFALNNINKTISDLASFTSPTWMFDLLQKPIAGVGITDDIKDNLTTLMRMASGDWEIKTGINAGMNRGVKSVAQLLPVSNQVFKIKQMGQKIYADPQGVIATGEKIMADWIIDGK